MAQQKLPVAISAQYNMYKEGFYVGQGAVQAQRVDGQPIGVAQSATSSPSGQGKTKQVNLPPELTARLIAILEEAAQYVPDCLPNE